MRSGWIRAGCLLAFLTANIARPFTSQPALPEVKAESGGAAIFNNVCVPCHESAGAAPRNSDAASNESHSDLSGADRRGDADTDPGTIRR
jgi:mono/diheme cytochrome c family protein